MIKSVMGLGFLFSLTLGQTFNVTTTSEFRQALENAALNTQEDTIELAAGIYKTTDDSIGTFLFSDTQEFNLTIQGMNNSLVILDGNNTDTVINLQNTKDTTINFKNITIRNSVFSSITALKSDQSLIIQECNISNNHYGAIDAPSVSIINSKIDNNHGNGIKTAKLYMQNTSISNNTARGLEILERGFVTIEDSNISYSGYDGIRIDDYVDMNITNSNVLYNTSRGITTGYRGSLHVLDSNISNNGTTGIYVNMYQRALISDSYIDSNNYGIYAFNGAYIALINSIIINNSETGFTGNSTTGTISIVVNSVFANNKLGVMGPGLVVNNIFYNNTENDLNTNLGKTYIFNNYIDYTKIIENTSDISTILKQDNVHSDETSMVLNTSFIPTGDSIVINKGLNSNTQTFIDYVNEFSQNSVLNAFVFDELEDDMNDDNRIVDSIVDLGAYEFSSTKPNIDSITYSGVAKQFNQLEFNTNFTLSDGRTLQEISYNFDGHYILDNSFIYETSGPKIVRVKLTDSEGEFTTLTLSLNIAPLAYEEMTFEQKIMTTVEANHLDDIQQEVSLQITSSYSQGRVQGEADGIQMCVDSPETYGIEASVKTVIIPMF